MPTKKSKEQYTTQNRAYCDVLSRTYDLDVGNRSEAPVDHCRKCGLRMQEANCEFIVTFFGFDSFYLMGCCAVLNKDIEQLFGG